MQKTEGVYWIVTAYYYKQIGNTITAIASASDVVRAKNEAQAKILFESSAAHKAFLTGGFISSATCTPLRGFYFDPANPPG